MNPMMPLMLILLIAGFLGSFMTFFGQLSGLKNRLSTLEREREKDRELLEAVLLEDTAKLKRLLGTRD